MKKLYQRAVEALAVVSRPDFVSGADLVPSITGHSIPREETVRHLLGLIPEIEPDHVVMHVGGGSGYLTAVLAERIQRTHPYLFHDVEPYNIEYMYDLA